MLKVTATSITYPITKIFNKSVTFPTRWKDSPVAPIPKSNHYCSPNSYRPVSLLSILSKLLEKHIYGVLFHHLEETQLILQLLKNGLEVGAVFFDFKKAFDSVPHKALLQKLEDLGINNYLLRWIYYSYLTNHKQ